MWKWRHLANQWPKIRRGAYQKIGLRAKKGGCVTVNETVAEVKAQALVDTGRHTSTSQD